MKNKLNASLAKVDYLASNWNRMLKDYIGFFKNSQGAFLGEKKTYEAKEGTIDDPSARKNVIVQTTVKEKFEWLLDNSKDYIDNLFRIEATNANGTAKTELVVDGESWGELTSLELLRLKSLLENNDFSSMLQLIPVRSDATRWTPTTDEEYKDRDIYETPLITGTSKTTIKESYVLDDPNIKHFKDLSGYNAQVAQKNTTEELGTYTHQHFSGQFSHRERAYILQRRSRLLAEVIEALKRCNESIVVSSKLDSEKILGYILKGKIDNI